jgi:ComF family protein
MVCECELNAPQNVHLCNECAHDLPFNTEPVVLADGNEKQYFHRAFAPFLYKDQITDLVLNLKYNSNGMIAETIAPYLAGAWLKEHSIHDTDFTLVPVPLCKSRRRKRGYNQATLLAIAVSKYLSMPVDENAIVRKRKTTVQKHMSVSERQKNLAGAFAVPNPAAIAGKKFIIVDDVFTSGSTVNECAKLLSAAGAVEINALVAAKVSTL